MGFQRHAAGVTVGLLPCTLAEPLASLCLAIQADLLVRPVRANLRLTCIAEMRGTFGE
jgi:hypothetical protein